ncbi:hypothetical protein PENNAL_c0390G09747 [Penicillium nalgiovense]|uniref:Uncharacterized protein n=1 Tax=Penicillium nalgiovense TaxID=60175 RepID=A0A1V6W492_PENNA|nr:hypothetical protein PENNAL_c0390G09747 [Penicillium nalgiovense]
MVVTLGNVKLTKAGEMDISEGHRGVSFREAGWVAVRKQLGVYDKFPPPLSPPKVLGGLGDGASDGGATAGGDGNTAGSDNGAASGDNGAAGGDDGGNVVAAPIVADYSGDRSWSHILLTGPAAILRPVGELANNPDNPDNILLKAPNMVLYADRQPRADKSKAKKGKGKAVGSGKASTRPITTSPAINKGKGKARAVPTTPTKAGGAHTTSSKSKKKRAAVDAPGSKDKDGKKKKRSKDTPDPPHHWPMIYRAEDNIWFSNVYERL